MTAALGSQGGGSGPSGPALGAALPSASPLQGKTRAECAATDAEPVASPASDTGTHASPGPVAGVSQASADGTTDLRTRSGEPGRTLSPEGRSQRPPQPPAQKDAGRARPPADKRHVPSGRRRDRPLRGPRGCRGESARAVPPLPARAEPEETGAARSAAHTPQGPGSPRARDPGAPRPRSPAAAPLEAPPGTASRGGARAGRAGGSAFRARPQGPRWSPRGRSRGSEVAARRRSAPPPRQSVLKTRFK